MKQVDLRIVYITAKDTAEARLIGTALVKEKLAACVNIHTDIASLYLWDGKLRDEPEVVLLAKTTLEKVPEIENRVRELGSYECPCILTLPIESANKEYGTWVEDVLKE